MSIQDLELIAVSCRLFQIIGRPGMFYVTKPYTVSGFPGLYCDLVHVFNNGMKPSSSGPAHELAAYLQRCMDAGSLVWLSPDPVCK